MYFASSTYIFILGGLTLGGAEKVAHFIMQSLIDDGKHVTLITRRSKSEDFFHLRGAHKRIEMGGAAVSENKFIGLLRNIAYIFRLRAEVKRIGKATIISFLTRPNIYTIIATRLTKNRLIVCERNDTTKQTHGWPWDTLRQKLYKHADVVTANSMVAINDMECYVPKEKLKFIPNPVDIPVLNMHAHPEVFSKLINVGRLVEAKNQEWLVEAFRTIRDKFPQWSLVILGDGDKRESIKNVISRNNLNDAVFLPGYVLDVSKYYKKSGIFVLTSHYEGTPNAMLEAMSHGLPCIVSDALPGAVELIGNKEAGVVYKHDNIDDFISKLEYLILNPEIRKKYGENAQLLVKKFSKDRVMSKWKAVL